MTRFSLPVRLALFALATAPVPAAAQDFSVLVSPPRYEAAAKAGDTWRNVLEITNVSPSDVRLGIQTADWTLKPDASVDFVYPLQSGSCRPWVGLEAAEVRLPANGKRRYRFEVAVPADAPPGECRFALMLEGDPQAVRGSAVPIAGRIGVIVYLAIGNAAPKLATVDQATVTGADGRRLPSLQVRNDGNAHGRLEGLVNGTDASGHRYAFAPNGLPILPGETRTIALTPQGDTPDAPPPALVFPVRLSGRLESAGGRLEVEGVFDE